MSTDRAPCNRFCEFHVSHACGKVRKLDHPVAANGVDEVGFHAPTTLLFCWNRNLVQFAFATASTQQPFIMIEYALQRAFTSADANLHGRCMMDHATEMIDASGSTGEFRQHVDAVWRTNLTQFARLGVDSLRCEDLCFREHTHRAPSGSVFREEFPA